MKFKKSIAVNLLFIIIFSVIFFAHSINAGWVGNENNATLFLSPNSGTYKVGTTFSVDILINTHGQRVVGVSAYFGYDPTVFRVVGIDNSASIFTTEWESIIDSANGVVKISRTIPTPGVNTINGKVATLNLQGLRDVTPSGDNFTFKFTAGVNADSQVILDDSLGTNILSGVNNGRYILDGTAPANITNFTATAGAQQISLSWTNPTAADFAGVRILRKTGSYPVDINDGTVVYDSNGTSYVDTGLSTGTTYYYKAFSRDAVLNYSSGAQVSATPRDTVAPASISNLSATALTSKTIRLSWTAVGDDGTTGTATSYEVRYSTAAITSANFSSASQASGAPSPKASGNAETMTVAGLGGDTTYYFAVKAIDEAGNAATISNVPTAKTYKLSDLNNDGFINIADAGIMMSYWGSTARPAADLNQDGAVNINDAGIMMSQWG